MNKPLTKVVSSTNDEQIVKAESVAKWGILAIRTEKDKDVVSGVVYYADSTSFWYALIEPGSAKDHKLLYCKHLKGLIEVIEDIPHKGYHVYLID